MSRTALKRSLRSPPRAAPPVAPVLLGLFDGFAGSTISTPTSASAEATTGVDLRILVAPDKWIPTTNETLLSKWVIAGDNRSYLLRIDGGTGNITALLSPNGITTDSLFSFTPTGFADGTEHGIKFTYTNVTGLGKFFTRSDADIDSNAGWTQLGTNFGGSTPAVFHSTADVQIGAFDTGASQSLLTGFVRKDQVREFIDGAVLLDFNVDDFDPAVSTTTVISSTTGETWTLGGSTSTTA